MFAGDLAALKFGRQAEGHDRCVQHDAIAGGAIRGDAGGELLFGELVGSRGDRVMRVGRLNDDRVEAEFFFEARGAVLDIGERDECGMAVGLEDVGFAEPFFLRWGRGGEREVGRERPACAVACRRCGGSRRATADSRSTKCECETIVDRDSTWLANRVASSGIAVIIDRCATIDFARIGARILFQTS